MKERKIKIGGKDYSCAFDFATLCEYEDVTGGMFKPAGLTTKAVSDLIYAAVAAHNDDVPAIEDFRKEMTFGEYQEANNVLGSQMAEFYHISDIAEGHVNEPVSEEGDGQKNV